MKIKPVFNDINICFAGNINYSEPMRTTIYSILRHADMSRKYEFIILSSDFTDEIKAKFDRFKADNIAVRFVDMTSFHEKVKDRGKNYITAETNYRLYLLSDDFAEYNRMLYLDCDMQATDDISKLYDIDLEGMAVGACEAVSLRAISVIKKAVFFDGKPCNVDYYRKNMLGLKNPESYFNAGMLVLDLEKCRGITDDMRAVEVLTAHKMHYNDQDCLNIIFEDNVKLIDVYWNYTTAIPKGAQNPDKRISERYTELLRNEYGIVHYIGSQKPWNSDVPLGEIYMQNNRQMIKEEITDEN